MVKFISSGAAGTMSAALVEGGLPRGCFSSILFIYCVNNSFGGIALSRWFIILSALFILTYMEGMLCGGHSLQVDF